MRKPVRIQVARAVVPEGELPKVSQTVYYANRDFMMQAVARVLEYEDPTSAIVFCRTRHEADSLADALLSRGFRPESLHGGLSQEQRDRVMKKFRSGAANLLVATDVAARGLDINHLSHVVNFHAAQTSETYTHRIGRVGRAGREGVAITVAEARESFLVRTIERQTRFKITTGAACRTWRRCRPSGWSARASGCARRRLAGGLDDYKSAIEPLFGEFNVVELALAAVKLAHEAGRSDEADVEIPVPPAPRESRDSGSARVGNGRDSRSMGGPPGAGGPGGPGRGVGRGMARLFMSAGRDAGIQRRDVVAAIESEVGIGSRDIGPIDIAERFTLVDVPNEVADYAIESLQGVRIRGRKLAVRRDRAAGGPPA